MNDFPLSDALRTERDTLAARWCLRLQQQRESKRLAPIEFDAQLAASLLDEVNQLLESARSRKIPRKHRGDAFRCFGEFPKNVSTCIEIYEVGSQVLGAFVVENSGSHSAWSRSTRNRYLGELDAVFHVLVHREIQGLCEFCLNHSAGWASDPTEQSPSGDRAEMNTPGRSFLSN